MRLDSLQSGGRFRLSNRAIADLRHVWKLLVLGLTPCSRKIRLEIEKTLRTGAGEGLSTGERLSDDRESQVGEASVCARSADSWVFCPRRKRRVVLVADSLANGGAERQLTLLATRLPDSWSAEVWAFDGGPFEDVLRDSGIKVTVAKRRWRHDVIPAVSLWRVLSENNFDVVHSWGWMSTAAAGPL